MEAVELLEQLPPGHELAMAHGNVSQRRMVVEDLEAAIAAGGRALELAPAIDHTEATVYALSTSVRRSYKPASRKGWASWRRR